MEPEVLKTENILAGEQNTAWKKKKIIIPQAQSVKFSKKKRKKRKKRVNFLLSEDAGIKSVVRFTFFSFTNPDPSADPVTPISYTSCTSTSKKREK